MVQQIIVVRRIKKRCIIVVDILPVRYCRPQQYPKELFSFLAILLVSIIISFHSTTTSTTAFVVPNNVGNIGKYHRFEQVVIPGWSKLQQQQQQQQQIASSLLLQHPHTTKLSPLRLLIQSSSSSAPTSTECSLRFRTPFCCRKRRNTLGPNVYINHVRDLCGFTATSHVQQQQRQSTALPLYSLTSGSIPPPSSSWIQLAMYKFRDRPGTYLLIPVIAALVGWFTNWLAVQMIFYPIQYRGWNFYRPNPENPLGFLGWQGIIPCKTRPMTNALVDMVTTQLLTVSEAFARIDPKHIATALSPSLIPFTKEIVQKEILSPSSFSNWIFTGPSRLINNILLTINTSLLEQVTIQLQQNAESVFQLRNCVVNQMIEQRSKLGQLFQECGKAELNFLTNSGLWFGFLLGIIQMLVALVWDNPWSLSMYVLFGDCFAARHRIAIFISCCFV
jgi:Protein of unknown function (DUF445)